MAKSLLSVLCDLWSWPYLQGCSVQFNQDGTGELYCGLEMNMCILADFEWKPLGDSSSALQQTVDFSSDFQATIDIELTLTRRVISRARNVPPDMNERNLTHAAFEPKTYKVQLAKGRFTADDWVFFGGSDTKTYPEKEHDLSYGLQLLFDKSPYPPLEEWVEGTMASRLVKANKLWECVDFYRDTEGVRVEDIMSPRTWDEKLQLLKDRMRAARQE